MVFGSAFLRHPGHRTGLFSGRGGNQGIFSGRGESRCCPPGSRACRGSRSIRGFHETLTIVPDVNNKKCIFFNQPPQSLLEPRSPNLPIPSSRRSPSAQQRARCVLGLRFDVGIRVRWQRDPPPRPLLRHGHD